MNFCLKKTNMNYTFSFKYIEELNIILHKHDFFFIIIQKVKWDEKEKQDEKAAPIVNWYRNSKLYKEKKQLRNKQRSITAVEIPVILLFTFK